MSQSVASVFPPVLPHYRFKYAQELDAGSAFKTKMNLSQGKLMCLMSSVCVFVTDPHTDQYSGKTKVILKPLEILGKSIDPRDQKWEPRLGLSNQSWQIPYGVWKRGVPSPYMFTSLHFYPCSCHMIARPSHHLLNFHLVHTKNHMVILIYCA